MEERLQKFMARCGVDSRRKCEELIANGMVEVNGEIVREPGVKIDPTRDKVIVAGKRLRAEKPAYYVHYKVKGVTTTVSDDLGRRTVMDCLPPIRERVYPVGRLDKESEGLLVLTNDGLLANYLTHPAHGIEKTYRVVAEGRIDRDILEQLADKGIRLGPVLVKPSRVELVRYDNENTVVRITVSEGINREVRRIFAALGHEVKKLLRIQVGPLSLEGMKRGATRPLTPRELSILRKGMAGMDLTEQEAQFPAGSARSRKPAGPRGRTKAPRQGKPDPAQAKPGRGRANYGEKPTAATAERRGAGGGSRNPRQGRLDSQSSPSRGRANYGEKPTAATAGRRGAAGGSRNPRQGKPDPAQPRPGRGRISGAAPSSGKPVRRGTTAPASAAAGRGRAGRMAALDQPRATVRPGKPLRPVKPAAAKSKPAKTGKAKPAGGATVHHPLQ